LTWRELGVVERETDSFVLGCEFEDSVEFWGSIQMPKRIVSSADPFQLDFFGATKPERKDFCVKGREKADQIPERVGRLEYVIDYEISVPGGLMKRNQEGNRPVEVFDSVCVVDLERVNRSEVVAVKHQRFVE